MKTRFFLLAGVLLLAALAAALLAWPHAPERIPTHWNLAGEVDAYGSRVALFMPAAIMAALVALWAVLPAMSPRRFSVDAFENTYWHLGAIVAGLMAYIQGVLLWTALEGQGEPSRALLAGIAVFYGLTGNLMGKVRRNFWIGIRTPWTLANERVWYATHRLAGKAMVAGAALALLATAVGLPPYCAIAAIVISAIVPAVYSLFYYKRLERGGELQA